MKPAPLLETGPSVTPPAMPEECLWGFPRSRILVWWLEEGGDGVGQMWFDTWVSAHRHLRGGPQHSPSHGRGCKSHFCDPVLTSGAVRAPTCPTSARSCW